jgi:hypothetical protein
MSDRIIIKFVLPIALTATSLFLLISGWFCYYKRDYSVIKQNECESVFISGILMLFIIGTILAFVLLFKIVDMCESNLRRSGLSQS